MSEDHSWRVSRNRHTEEHPQWGERRTEPLAPITRCYAAEVERAKAARFFPSVMAESGAKSRYIGRVFHGFSKLYVEKMIEMTDADIVRAPFFKHHINR